VRGARLGRSGPRISRLGVGGWQASGPGPWGSGQGSDDDEAVAALRRAVESGVTWVDTAASYGLGHSEQIVAQALRPWRIGEDVLVFTKCGHPWDPPDRIRTDLGAASIRLECEGSLRRLGVERIDVYQFHHPDPTTPIEESWSTMSELIDEGKVRWAGVSNFDVDLLDRCEAIRHVDCLQPELNLLRRDALLDVIPWCRDHGTGVVVYSPLATGALGGSYRRAHFDAFPPDDWRHGRSGPILGLVERLRPLASSAGISVAALAVAWTLSKEGVTAAICGARYPQQVDGWITAADVDTPSESLTRVGSILSEIEARET